MARSRWRSWIDRQRSYGFTTQAPSGRQQSYGGLNDRDRPAALYGGSTIRNRPALVRRLRSRNRPARRTVAQRLTIDRQRSTADVNYQPTGPPTASAPTADCALSGLRDRRPPALYGGCTIIRPAGPPPPTLLWWLE